MERILKTASAAIRQIDNFIDEIENGMLLFRESVNNYADGKIPEFEKRLQLVEDKESAADTLQRSIENDFLVHSLLPQLASDVLHLLDKTDDILDKAKYVLQQFSVELPQMPDTIKADFKSLNSVSNEAAVEAIAAVRVFFTQPELAKEHINKIYFYERESDRAANDLRRVIFQSTPDIDLAQKEQLRYFTRHVEQISDAAEDVGDILSLLILKVML